MVSIEYWARWFAIIMMLQEVMEPQFEEAGEKKKNREATVRVRSQRNRVATRTGTRWN
jgi:hypothetical protein